LSIFCAFRCFLHKKDPPPLLERKALSFISMSFFYYIRKIFSEKGKTLRILNISEKNFLL